MEFLALIWSWVVAAWAWLNANPVLAMLILVALVSRRPDTRALEAEIADLTARLEDLEAR